MSHAQNKSASTRPWVLVLDPVEAVRQACREACGARGLESRFAESVPEALSLVYSSKPVAVLVSFGLPIMPGSSLVAALGASRAHRAIPVCAIVASRNGRESFAAYEPAACIERSGDLRASVDTFLEELGLQVPTGDASISPASRSAPRLLLAEDSTTNQLILARLLHIAGADVTVVSDGIEALSAAESSDFDIVLMDIEMPKMDGMECAAKLRELGFERPIIAVTGHDEEAISSDAFDRHFDGFLQKPVDKNDIRNLLNLYRRRRAA